MWRPAISLISVLMVAGSARGTTVDLVWTGGSDAFAGIGTSGASLDIGAFPTTLTLDIVITADAAGISAATIDLSFDDDGRNELDLVSYSELSWSSGDGSASLIQATPGIEFARESQLLGPSGQLLGFEGFTLGQGPADVRFSFARVAFVTDTLRVRFLDGPDIFGTARDVFDNSGRPISLAISTASVGSIPEPSTLALLAGGLAALSAARRRRLVFGRIHAGSLALRSSSDQRRGR